MVIKANLMLVKIRLNIPLKLHHSTAISIICFFFFTSSIWVSNLALVTRPVNLPAKKTDYVIISSKIYARLFLSFEQIFLDKNPWVSDNQI